MTLTTASARAQARLDGLPDHGGPAVESLVDLLLARLDDAFDHRAVVDVLGSQLTLGSQSNLGSPSNLGSQSNLGLPCEWTWGEVIAAAVAQARQFESAGLLRGQRMAHVGTHSVDWIVTHLACLLSGIVSVGLHADASLDEQREQLGWLKPKGIVYTGAGARMQLRDVPAETIQIDRRVERLGRPRDATHGFWADDWRTLLADRQALRADVQQRAIACDPDACAVIFLSSGTTGRPHGVLHCQRALAANSLAAAELFLDDAADVRLSWLPMSHSLSYTGDLATAILRGACLSVVTDRRRIREACSALPPTVILGVPAFFERLERGVQSGAIPDLAAAIGGRVRVCVSGGAPLRQRTIDVFESLGVPLVQGYGLAEAGPVVTLSTPRNARRGTVGPPLAGVEVSIDSRPHTIGQLLVRTPSRAIGVINPEQNSDASADPFESGRSSAARGSGGHADWLATGDLAEIDTHGHVRITGRLVDTLVLASGVKLPPSEVERAIAEDSAVAQVCVLGDGLPWPVALVVPDPHVLRTAMRRMGVRVLGRRQAMTHPRVLAWLGRRIARCQQNLPRAWRVRRAVLIGRPFETSRGEATSSLKLQRRAIAEHFRWVTDAAAWLQRPAWMAIVGMRSTACGADASSDPALVALSASAKHSDGQNVLPGKHGQPRGLQPIPGMVTRTDRPGWVATSVWRVGSVCGGGFAEAAAHAAEAPRDAIVGVMDQADREIDHLRATRRLYESLPEQSAALRAPLDDAPELQQGLFSRVAEESLGGTGFWGLAVPEAFGGSGCSLLELVHAITRMAANAPTAAGMLSVHSSIGAVSALVAFGSAEQRLRYLPGLAQGSPLSIFGATEPDAGCDLSRIRTTIARRDGRLFLSGTKMFITGATYGRMVKLLALLDGHASVVLVRLPETDTATFRLRGYALHPLKHAHNAAIEFDRFEVHASDLLVPMSNGSPADGMQIVWHGLNRGRVTLAAQAAGTLRILLAGARDHAIKRHTWSAPIGSRQLVQGRLARIAASALACDSLAAWAARSIDNGQTGEWEAITAKIVASQCVREAAIDALGIHGGRSFLVGHPLGDSLHDHLAVTVYEGESDLLGLALFKGLCKHHPLSTAHSGASAVSRAAGWLMWRAGRLGYSGGGQDNSILDESLRTFAREARRLLARLAIRMDRFLRRHGRGAASRQLEIGALSAEMRDLLSVLAVAHHADARGDDSAISIADCWCRLALSRASGTKLTAADHAAIGRLGESIVLGPLLAQKPGA